MPHKHRFLRVYLKSVKDNNEILKLWFQGQTTNIEIFVGILGGRLLSYHVTLSKLS